MSRKMQPADVPALLAPPESAALLLDVDGTLATIVPRPELAQILPDAATELERLVARYAVVGVVTGRPTPQVASLVGVEGIRYEGLYGIAGAPPVSEELLRRVEAAAAPVEAAWVEHKGISLTVHVRQSPDPEEAEATLLPLLGEIARAQGMELVLGKLAMELAPPGPRKGAAVERLANEAGARSVLYAGDDLPDLEAFEALDRLAWKGLTTVKVAVRGAEERAELEAASDLVVEGPTGMVTLLRLL
jgi:trehalose 6-phosphate phosphatase